MEDGVKVFVYCLIGVTCIIFNGAETALIIKGNKKFKTYDQLLMSLAISDFLVGLSSVVYSCLISSIPSSLSRQIFTFMVSFSFVASVLNLLLIGLDRLLAVRLPLKHRIWAERRYVIKAILFIWIFLAIEMIVLAAIGISKPANMDGPRHFFDAVLPFLIFCSFLALSFLYGQIFYYYAVSQRKLNVIRSNGKNVARKMIATKQSINKESSYISSLSDDSAMQSLGPSSAISEKTSYSFLEAETDSRNEVARVDATMVDEITADSELSRKHNAKKRTARRGKKKACSFCCRQWALFITCILVISSFFLCTLPFAIHMLIWKKSSLEVLLVANSLTNPIIYFYKGADHKTIMNLLRKGKTSEAVKEQSHCRCNEMKK